MSYSLANPFVSALLGTLAGLVVGWFWRNVRVRELTRELGACLPRAARLHQVEEILAERNGQLAALHTELGDLRQEQVRASATASAQPEPQQSSLPLVGETPKRRKSGSRASP